MIFMSTAAACAFLKGNMVSGSPDPNVSSIGQMAGLWAHCLFSDAID
jgi:hypothetical protein